MNNINFAKKIFVALSLGCMAWAGSVAHASSQDVTEAAGMALIKSDTLTRHLNYWPDGRDIVCMNGTQRYTRALYGGPSAFRLETSDRPLFATYMKNNCRNLSMSLIVNGQDGAGEKTVIPLDSVIFDCEARYIGGRRTYRLTHGEWRMDISCLASMTQDGAIWRFVTEGLPQGAELMAELCMARSSKFNRNGDLGVDDLTHFDPSPSRDSLVVARWAADGTTYLSLVDNRDLKAYAGTAPVQKKARRGARNAKNVAMAMPLMTSDEGQKIYDREEAARQAVMSRVEITTPDPVFNVTGSVLMAAADGLWDGLTWQHGCIGWRTPLAGWRGCYVGDAVGWQDRSYRHFSAYAKSQVTDVPPVLAHPQQDSTLNLARAVKKWGTQMYSDGYICRYPERNNTMHHYDMNLNYIDGLLWHLSYDADPAQLREFFPVLKRHLEWEKRNFDPDHDHLYDAYCCIWASDALYYNSGAVTHSSAYNYRGNRLAARIAEILGEDPTPYREEAAAILDAMNSRLWLGDRGHWAEFEDFMGLKRKHKSAALWSVYTPIDCGACSTEQAYLATRYVDRDIPHIPFRVVGEQRERLGKDSIFCTLSTTDWMPYDWSTNNVAHEEVANMALAYFQAGRSDEGFKLLKSDLIDEMFVGRSPGNFGQISYFDKVVKEAYRDFGDNVGISSRALINGLFGITPDALHGKCVIKPAFPDSWNEASIRTPYLSYKFRREGTRDIYEIEHHFAQPLQISIRTNAGGGAYLDTEGTSDTIQTIIVDRTQLPQPIRHTIPASSRAHVSDPAYLSSMGLDDITPDAQDRHVYIDLSEAYNSNVDDVFKNKYLSPRSPYTTLELPVQGIGQWCHPEHTAVIEDDGLRQCLEPVTMGKKATGNTRQGIFDTKHGVRFMLPIEGQNICYTSLWDNYPNSITLPMPKRGANGGQVKGISAAYLMMAGTTNNMQSRIDNALVIATYDTGEQDTLRLENPINWPTINEEYNYDGHAFWTAARQPLRFRLDNGAVGRKVSLLATGATAADTHRGGGSDVMMGMDRAIENGAGVILKMPLDPRRRLRSLSLVTLSNDIVTGIMAVTLEREK